MFSRSSQLSEFIRVARYARYLPEKGRRETWAEQVDRVMSMHREFYIGIDNPDLINVMNEIRDAMINKEILGSQRGLQFGGLAILNKHARLYNCTATYMDRPRAFQEVMWLLLCGCGVGISVQIHHVNQLPVLNRPINGTKQVVIPDSIEGWADAVGELMNSYFVPGSARVEFDFSNIRPKGSIIHNMDGKAPGPGPLHRALEKIRTICDRSGERLRPIDVFDIITHASDAVVAGGVRRSALLTIFSADDHEMASAKTGNWFVDNPQRARSNNSVLLLRDRTTFEQFHSIIEHTRQFGEPGFIWADDTEVLYNPCCEIQLYARDSNGTSGCEFCNLSEINMKKITTPEEFYRACRLASALCTLQVGYCSFPYLGSVTESIVKHEALIGVSMTGMMDSPAIAFDPEVQRAGAKIVVETNRHFAKILGFNPAARCTTVKPAGTTSCILDTASGIHPHHSKRYFRRVQSNCLEHTLNFYKSKNPDSVEPSVWSSNGTDEVITFLCETHANAKTKKEVGALELLKFVHLTQNNWIKFGSESARKHNVSNTITVKPEEWEDVIQYIYTHRSDFVGVSLLPMSGDRDYIQAPFQEVLTRCELENQYGPNIVSAIRPLLLRAKRLFDNLYKACDELRCDRLSVIGSSRKVQWVRCAKSFAKNRFNGDIQKLIYCLKDVDAYKQWNRISSRTVPVNWEEFTEKEDNTKQVSDPACSGGACQIIKL